MSKKFQFDPSRKAEVAQALESLKNDTLSSLSAEFVVGGVAVPEWIKGAPEWIKAAEPAVE